ncbi:MAG: hypothetical protein WCT11_00305 [Candidatus Magasanikbacteria bacterium]
MVKKTKEKQQPKIEGAESVVGAGDASSVKGPNEKGALRKAVDRLLGKNPEQTLEQSVKFTPGRMFEYEKGELPGVGMSWEEIGELIYASFDVDILYRGGLSPWVKRIFSDFPNSEKEFDNLDYTEKAKYEKLIEKKLEEIKGEFAKSKNTELLNKFYAMYSLECYEDVSSLYEVRESLEDERIGSDDVDEDAIEKIKEGVEMDIKKGIESSVKLFQPVREKLTKLGFELETVSSWNVQASKQVGIHRFSFVIDQFTGSMTSPDDMVKFWEGKKLGKTVDLAKIIKDDKIFSVHITENLRKQVKEQYRDEYNLEDITEEVLRIEDITFSDLLKKMDTLVDEILAAKEAGGSKLETTEKGELPGIGLSWQEITAISVNNDDVAAEKFFGQITKDERVELDEYFGKNSKSSPSSHATAVIEKRFIKSGNINLRNKFVAMCQIDDLRRNYYEDKDVQAGLERLNQIEQKFAKKGFRTTRINHLNMQYNMEKVVDGNVFDLMFTQKSRHGDFRISTMLIKTKTGEVPNSQLVEDGEYESFERVLDYVDGGDDSIDNDIARLLTKSKEGKYTTSDVNKVLSVGHQRSYERIKDQIKKTPPERYHAEVWEGSYSERMSKAERLLKDPSLSDGERKVIKIEWNRLNDREQIEKQRELAFRKSTTDLSAKEIREVSKKFDNEISQVDQTARKALENLSKESGSDQFLRKMIKDGMLHIQYDSEGAAKHIRPDEYRDSTKKTELKNAATEASVERQNKELFGLSEEEKKLTGDERKKVIEKKRKEILEKIKEKVRGVASDLEKNKPNAGFHELFRSIFKGVNELGGKAGDKVENREFLKDLFADTELLKELLTKFNFVDDSRQDFNVYTNAPGTETVRSLVGILREFFPDEADLIAGDAINTIFLESRHKDMERSSRRTTSESPKYVKGVTDFGDVDFGADYTSYWRLFEVVFKGLGVSVKPDQLKAFNEKILTNVNSALLLAESKLIVGQGHGDFNVGNLYLETYKKFYGESGARTLATEALFPSLVDDKEKQRKIGAGREFNIMGLGGHSRNAGAILQIFKEHGLIDLKSANQMVRVAEFIDQLDGGRSAGGISTNREIIDTKEAISTVFSKEQAANNALAEEIDELDLDSMEPAEALAYLKKKKEARGSKKESIAPETEKEKEARSRYDQRIVACESENVANYGFQYGDWGRDRIIIDIEEAKVLPTDVQCKKIIDIYKEAIINESNYENISITARLLKNFVRLTSFVPDSSTMEKISKKVKDAKELLRKNR